MNWFLMTVGYSGYFPKAPGTAGSIVSWFLALPILIFFDSFTLFLASMFVTLLGIDIINKYEQNGGLHDDKRIVIDELAGVWIALSIAPAFGTYEIFDIKNGFLIQAILSLLLFRYFDIKKPSIIGRIDREAKGGVGVMLDDVIAGFAAGITSALIWQGWLELQNYL
jgi:phosphatidylglycerophosphatase A